MTLNSQVFCVKLRSILLLFSVTRYHSLCSKEIEGKMLLNVFTYKSVMS